MDFTWIAILASLAMGFGTALIFVFAVKGNYFQNLEDAEYQVHGLGTDIAMHASSVVLMDNDLRKIPEIFDLAQRALGIIHQNLFWAFFFNVVGISLAITGVLSPIFAAAAMLLSSLAVVTNSLRMRHTPTSNK